MDIYHAWFDIKPGVGDTAFSEKLTGYMEHLVGAQLIHGWRLTRRKLGLGPRTIGEFHLMMEVRDLAQLEAAFTHVSGRREPVEGLHFGVNSQVTNVQFALYRDFPDPHRHRGEERF